MVLDRRDAINARYVMALQLLQRGPFRSVYLMQQDRSPVLLGPGRDWPEESAFYKALMAHVEQGAVLRYVIPPREIRRQVRQRAAQFPDVDHAMSRLVWEGGCVAVAGPGCAHIIKKMPEDGLLLPFRGGYPRALVVERSNGLVEAMLIADAGTCQTWVPWLEPSLAARFLERCIEFYDECEPVTPRDLAAIRLAMTQLPTPLTDPAASAEVRA